MIRESLIQKTGWGDADFRWRGGDVSRIEALSDAVFAIAFALLFLSTSPIASANDLASWLQKFPALLICFVFLMMPWWAHYKFFRRFGFQDLWTTVLNAALLFLVLFYVYPLQFLFTNLLGGLLGFVDSSDLRERFTGAGNWLMIVYGCAFVGIFGCLALLNLHGYRCRARFELNAVEVAMTRNEILSHMIMVTAGCASIAMSLAGVHQFWCGMVYALVGPLHGIRGFHLGKTIERLRGA